MRKQKRKTGDGRFKNDWRNWKSEIWNLKSGKPQLQFAKLGGRKPRISNSGSEISNFKSEIEDLPPKLKNLSFRTCSFPALLAILQLAVDSFSFFFLRIFVSSSQAQTTCAIRRFSSACCALRRGGEAPVVKLLRLVSSVRETGDHGGVVQTVFHFRQTQIELA